jgi:hypothetical protein
MQLSGGPNDPRHVSRQKHEDGDRTARDGGIGRD